MIKNNYIYHSGIKGQKWYNRRYQNEDGTYTEEGKKRRRVFISGSSKTQTKDSGYYRKKLPKPVRNYIDEIIKDKGTIIVGDAPGIDRQVQNYLKDSKYDNVEVYGPGKKLRYLADDKWSANPIDAPEFEEGSSEWLAKKDIAMEKASNEGLAIVLENGGAGATRNNIQRLLDKNKDVKVFELYSNKKDKWIT